MTTKKSKERTPESFAGSCVVCLTGTDPTITQRGVAA